MEVMALEDLVAAKKIQRDKDWPMLRRLVDASYDSARDGDASAEQVTFWLAELRSPEFLREAISRFPPPIVRTGNPCDGSSSRCVTPRDERDNPRNGPRRGRRPACWPPRLQRALA